MKQTRHEILKDLNKDSDSLFSRFSSSTRVIDIPTHTNVPVSKVARKAAYKSMKERTL